jgi:hypothetical protein
MGAAAVFEMIAAAPDNIKFSAKPRRGLGFDSSPILLTVGTGFGEFVAVRN